MHPRCLVESTRRCFSFVSFVFFVWFLPAATKYWKKSTRYMEGCNVHLKRCFFLMRIHEWWLKKTDPPRKVVTLWSLLRFKEMDEPQTAAVMVISEDGGTFFELFRDRWREEWWRMVGWWKNKKHDAGWGNPTTRRSESSKRQIYRCSFGDSATVWKKRSTWVLVKIAECVESLSVPVVGLYTICLYIYIYNYMYICLCPNLCVFLVQVGLKTKVQQMVTRVDHVYRIRV